MNESAILTVIRPIVTVTLAGKPGQFIGSNSGTLRSGDLRMRKQIGGSYVG